MQTKEIRRKTTGENSIVKNAKAKFQPRGGYAPK